MKRLIAVDLDGTLLTREKRISPRTQAALTRAMAQGHHVVIATGRSTRGSMTYYNELDLNTPMVNFNGAFVHHAKDPDWGQHHFPLDRDTALRVVEACERFDIANILAEICDDYYLRRHDEDLIKFIGDGSLPVAIGHIRDVLPDHPTALLVRPNESKIKQLRDHLHEHHANVVEHRLWGAPWNVIEIVRAGITKATGLQLIAERLQIPQEHIIAFGDEDNDFEMVQYAGLGVAMGNANPHLKQIANHITGTNDEDGIAQVLEKLLD